MQISRIRLSDKTSRLCFRVQRHLQFLNPLRSLQDAQSPRFFTTYCVCLELRSLPSTGITQLHRYYEPLRHPKAPSLSLAGFRLVVALTTPWGFPCCVRFPCVHAAATTPAQRLGVLIRSVTQPCQPSPKGLSGRPAHRPFRGLLSVHSRCGLHTRTVTHFVTATRGLQTFRHLHACPGCFRLERSPGGACTRWKSAALSRRTWTGGLRDVSGFWGRCLGTGHSDA